MPLPMVHFSTAVKVNTLKDAKSPEYYLGSISPDAVHMRANYVSEDKVVSHCNARTMEAIDELDALCAIADISSGKEREFLLWQERFIRRRSQPGNTEPCIGITAERAGTLIT